MSDKAYNRISQILTTGEEIEFLTSQRQHIFNWIPDHVAITNRRLIIFEAKLFSSKFHDFLWIDLEDAHLSEQFLSATFSMRKTNGFMVTISTLHKHYARELYRMAQEMEEQARYTRREMTLEEHRAGANSTVINNATVTPNSEGNLKPVRLKPALNPAEHKISATAKLKDLKEMLNEDLISENEYQEKKQQILDEM